MKKISSILISALLIFSTGCAPKLHTWSEGYPADNPQILNREQKKAEFEKYAISKINRDSVKFSYESGQDKYYTIESFSPIIYKYSDIAPAEFKNAADIAFYTKIIDWLVLAGAFIPTLSVFVNNGYSSDINILNVIGWSFWGIVIVTDTILHYFENQSYNNILSDYLNGLNEYIYKNQQTSLKDSGEKKEVGNKYFSMELYRF